MTAPAQQYPYQEMDPTAGASSRMPYLPLTLSWGTQSTTVSDLLDTGATINVLPHSVGDALGAAWEQQATPVRLTGNMARIEARVLVVQATVGPFAPIRLAFAWAQTDGMPVILGQTNFFMEFDACFFRSRSTFEVRPKS